MSSPSNSAAAAAAPTEETKKPASLLNRTKDSVDHNSDKKPSSLLEPAKANPTPDTAPSAAAAAAAAPPSNQAKKETTVLDLPKDNLGHIADLLGKPSSVLDLAHAHPTLDTAVRSLKWKCAKCTENVFVVDCCDNKLAFPTSKPPFSCDGCGKTFCNQFKYERYNQTKQKLVGTNVACLLHECRRRSCRKDQGNFCEGCILFCDVDGCKTRGCPKHFKECSVPGCGFKACDGCNSDRCYFCAEYYCREHADWEYGDMAQCTSGEHRIPLISCNALGGQPGRQCPRFMYNAWDELFCPECFGYFLEGNGLEPFCCDGCGKNVELLSPTELREWGSKDGKAHRYTCGHGDCEGNNFCRDCIHACGFDKDIHHGIKPAPFRCYASMCLKHSNFKKCAAAGCGLKACHRHDFAMVSDKCDYCKEHYCAEHCDLAGSDGLVILKQCQGTCGKKSCNADGGQDGRQCPIITSEDGMCAACHVAREEEESGDERAGGGSAEEEEDKLNEEAVGEGSLKKRQKTA